MSEGSADLITIDIQSKLDGLPCTPTKPSIFRVDKHLRSVGLETIYEPEIIAIGPYHHGKSQLQNMEKIKYRYLKRLLKRKNEQKVDMYVNCVSAMEKRARKCYGEPLDLNENEFVTVMLLDGCFIIELFRYCGSKLLRDVDDPILEHERILSQVRHDIFLLENQLPFFVLNQLFNMTTAPDDDSEPELISLALKFAGDMFPNISPSGVLNSLPVKNFDHLFGLIHDAWCHPFAEIISTGNKIRGNINSISWLREEVGIKLKKAKGNDSLMNITFMNGELRIPRLSIFDETESQFRNLIAYEQYLPNEETRYVSDYIFFMHCLINNSKDVELLRSHGIIENWLGGDEEVSLMFNRLGKNILTSSRFCYSQVFTNVNRHCSRRRKKWKANLRKNYFNSPWSIIKLIAAVALLLLAFTQTAYTVLAYYTLKR